MKTAFSFLFLFFWSIILFGQQSLQGFRLDEVRLSEGPFKTAEQTDKAYMLSLNPDRLLAPYLKESGLSPKAESYGNWENTGLDGHIGGHYISALSLMYASTGDETIKQRLNYMINELERCQKRNGDGYLSGVPGGKSMWKQIAAGNIQASSFSLNGKWVPLYNIHKIFAGLHDAYLYGGNNKAKKMLIRMTDWCINLVSKLSDEQIQTMLVSEHGGLNEVFANVYQLTGKQKYLQLARKFSDQSILKPLLEKRDALNGLHANTQIPKVIGYEQIALADRDTAWAEAANFFWQTVVRHRSVAIGGNSVREHFHPANDFSSMMESREGPETCNSYNMLKLTKQLFLASPSNEYLDYYERTLYNHILTSQRNSGGFVYFTPMRPGHYRTYSNAQESFWCCVGSGLENHGKYGELIYAHTNRDLYVNLFIPSTLTWKDKGIELIQETSFPKTENTSIRLKLKTKKRFAINIRYPSWLEKGKMSIVVNNRITEVLDRGNGYVSIERDWQNQDVIKISLPMHNTAEFLPDGSNWVSFLHGPVVLAAEVDTLTEPNLQADGSRMGHIASGELFPVTDAPLLSGDKANIGSLLTPGKDSSLTFTFQNIVYQKKYKSIKLVPFYELSEKRYTIYFPYSTPEKLIERAAELGLAEAERTKLEQATVDIVNTGEQQPESDHQFKGANTTAGIFQDRHYRSASGWFSYSLKNPGMSGKKIALTLYGGDKNRSFSILINNKPIGTMTLSGDKGSGFYTSYFNIPESLVSEQMEIRFLAEPNSSVANVFELRLVK